jgi:hypothetical protein
MCLLICPQNGHRIRRICIPIFTSTRFPESSRNGLSHRPNDDRASSVFRKRYSQWTVPDLVRLISTPLDPFLTNATMARCQTEKNIAGGRLLKSVACEQHGQSRISSRSHWVSKTRTHDWLNTRFTTRKTRGVSYLSRCIKEPREFP